jgi:hypothetical protein
MTQTARIMMHQTKTTHCVVPKFRHFAILQTTP